jgi:hypothetical protein
LGLALALLVAIVGCGGSGNGGGGGTDTGGSTGVVRVSIDPVSATVAPGGTRTFSANVTGTTNTAVNWTATGGSITQAGVFTAPDTTGTYKVRAISQADTSVIAESTVTVAIPGEITVAVSPATTTIGTGKSKKFTATVTGTDDKAVTWEADAGTITTTGFYTAPQEPGVYTVTAHSAVKPEAIGTATVTVSGTALTVFITPQNPVLGTRESVDLDATVTNASNTSVTWSASGGSIDSNGLFTAPDDAGTYTITATSVQDPSVSAEIQVTVNPIFVAVTPSSVTLTTGATQTFTANVTGAKDKSVSWSATGGTISDSGFYTAPATAGTYTVTATSNVDNRRIGTATVTVVDAFSVFYDFESGVPGAWVPTNLNETAPGGQKFLGRLSGSDSATLTLSSLTTHRKLRVSFDLYVIGDWQNEKVTVTVAGTNVFSQGFSNVTGVNQSYPDSGSNAPGTGRTAADTLGYPFAGTLLFKDTTYHISIDVDHTATSAQIKWLATLSKAKENQAWGLDNVRIEAIP